MKLIMYITVLMSYMLAINDFTAHISNTCININVTALIGTPITYYLEHFEQECRSTFT